MRDLAFGSWRMWLASSPLFSVRMFADISPRVIPGGQCLVCGMLTDGPEGSSCSTGAHSSF